MSTLTGVSVTSPSSTPPPLQTNNVKTSKQIIDQLKYYILLHLVFGINRTYLLKYNKTVAIVCVLYALGVSLAVSYLGSMFSGSDYITFQFLKYGFIFVNFSLIILSLTNNKKIFKKFFKLLSEVDETLNIENDLDRTSSLNGNILCYTFFVLFSNAFHAFYIHGFLYNLQKLLLFQTPIFFVSCVIDFEQIFFAIPLKLVYARVCVIKAHVDRFCETESNDEGDYHNRNKNDSELLARKSELDISRLHALYQKLYKCSVLLSGVLSLSFTLTYLMSGAYTIIFLNRLLNIVQLMELNGGVIVSIINVIIRSFKGVVQVALPCHYSSKITTEVTSMRTTLHNYLSLNIAMDKIKRRKLKAFYSFIKDFNFDFNIYGMFRLNMSLALSYISLCVTSLIIIVQFSKLIDSL